MIAKIVLCIICRRQLRSKHGKALGMGLVCAKKNPARAEEQRGQMTLFKGRELNRRARLKR